MRANLVSRSQCSTLGSVWWACLALTTTTRLLLAAAAPAMDSPRPEPQADSGEQPWPWPWLGAEKEWNREEDSEERQASAPEAAPDNQTEGSFRLDDDKVVILCNLTRGSSENQLAAQISDGLLPEEQQQQQSARKVKRATTEEERNALAARVRNFRCHSPAKAILLPRDRRPAKKSLNQLVPGDSIDKLLFGGKEPRWMDECNQRPPQNETVVRLWVSPRRRSVEDINQIKRNAYSTTSKHASKSDDAIVRHKRSTTELANNNYNNNVDGPHKSYQGQLYKFQGGERSAILFRAGGSHAASQNSNNNNKWRPHGQKPLATEGSTGGKWWKSKKTTFTLSKANWLQPYHYSRSAPTGALANHKHRFLVSQPDEFGAIVPPANRIDSNNHELNPQAASQAARKTQSVEPAAAIGGDKDMMTGRQQNLTKIRDLVRDLYELDIKLNFRLAQGYKTVNYLAKNIQVAMEMTTSDDTYKRAANISAERRQEIIAQRKWMPKFEELVVVGTGEHVNRASLYNITSGLYHPQASALMSNMTKYIQLFAVAVEQMVYDRRYFYENSSKNNHVEHHYRALERGSQEILCDASLFLNYISQWNQKRDEFNRLYRIEKPKSIGEFGEFYEKLINNRLIRDRPIAEGFRAIESALDRAWRRLSPTEQNDKLRQLELLLPENMVKMVADRKYLNSPPEQRPQPVIVRHLSYPSHFWRDIMPLEQRQLYSARERAVRDISIFQDMQLFLGSYGTLLHNNVFE
jgi:hypothetical protein